MEIIVEIREPDQLRSRTERLNTREFIIGRSWQARVHVQDPQVDAEHLRLQFDPKTNQYLVEDCQTLNGSMLAGNRLHQRQVLPFGQWLEFGASQMRLHRRSDPVPAAIKRSGFDQWTTRLLNVKTALGLALAAILVVSLLEHAEQARVFQWENQASSLIYLVAGLLTWSIFWGGVARLTRQKFQFWQHLALISALMIIDQLFSQLNGLLEFNVLWPLFSSWSTVIFMALSLGFWALVSLRMSTNLGLKTRIGITLTLVGSFMFTEQILPQIRSQDSVYASRLTTVSRPPSWLIAPTNDKGQYMQQIDLTFNQADQLAAEIRAEKENLKSVPD